MFVSESGLLKRIKNKEFAGFYIFYGEENFLIKAAVKTIVKELVPNNFIYFNYRKIYFEDVDFNEVETFLYGAPVFSSNKVLLIKDVDVEKLNSKYINMLGKILNDKPKESILIFSIVGKSAEIKKSLNFKKLINIYSNIIYSEFSFKSVSYLCNMFCRSLKKRGFLISKEDMLFLIERCEKTIEAISLELGKLCSFSDNIITKNDILLLTRPKIENTAFDITKNLLAGKKKEAMEIFYRLVEEGFNVNLIFSAISICFIDMYRAKCAKVKGVSYNDILKYFDYSKKEFRIKNAFSNCDIYSLDRLREFVILLSDIDNKVKTKGVSINFMLERFLFSNRF